jgi:hypothetical protein
MAGAITAIAALSLGTLVALALVAAAVAVRGEDRDYTLVGEAPNLISRFVRRLMGLARRDLDAEILRSARRLVH